MRVRTKEAFGARQSPNWEQTYFFGTGYESIFAYLGSDVQCSKGEPSSQSWDHTTTCEFMQKEKTINNIPPRNATMG